MSAFIRSRRCRFTALVLALAVLHSAPGLAAYSALAANLKAAPVTGGAAAPAVRVDAAIGSASLIAPAGLVPSASLNGSLNMGAMRLAPVPSLPSDAPVAADAAASPLAPAAAPAPSVLSGRRDGIVLIGPAGAGKTAVVSELAERIAVLDAAKPSAANESRSASSLSAVPVLGRIFDGIRARSGDAAAPVAGSPSAFTPLSAPADGPALPGSRPPAPPSGPDGPVSAAPGRARVTVGLLLAVGGGVGAWYAAPVVLPVLLGLAAYLPFALPMLPLVAYKSILAAAGAGAGLAAFSTETWKDFPRDLRDDAVGAARTTFRFWARFGLIFDAVLRGKSTDEAMKGEVSANILTYPVIAWIPVILGYLFAPVFFVLGAAWRVVGTPLLAAFRGAREVAVGFFPWLGRVFRLIGRVLRDILPFAGGLVWGALRGVFFGAAAGAVILAGPVFRDAVAAKYEPKTLPGWLAYRLMQLGGLAASLVLGLAGAAVGAVVSPVHALLSAFERAFAWSDVSEGAERFFKRWLDALSEDVAFEQLLGRGTASAGAETLAARGSRLVNGALIGAALLPALPFVALATLLRSVSAAVRGAEVPRRSTDWEKHMPAKGAERPVEGDAGFALPVALGLLGAAAGVAAWSAFGAGLVMVSTLMGLALYAAAAALGAALGLALSQPKALASAPGAVVADASRAGALAWTGWTDAGRRAVVAVLGAEKAAPLGALLAAIPAAVMTLVSGVAGGVHGLAGTLGKASWKGFMETVRRFIPALRRFLSFVVRILKNILPFAFGFLWGSLVGLFKTSFMTAVSFFKPVIEAFEAESDANTRPSEAQVGFGLLLGLTLLPLAAAVFAGGLALGATLGLPLILTFGLSRGVKWARPSEKSVAYWRAWERAVDRAAQDALNAVSGVFNGVGAEMPAWRLYVRVASVLLGSPVTAFVVVAAAAKAYLRSFAYARVLADGGQLPAATEPKAPAAGSPEAPAATPAGKPPVALAAAAGLLGLAAGTASVFFFGLPFLAGLAGWTLWAGYAGVFAGLPLLGLATGLALTQPAFWVDVVPLAVSHGKAGMLRSYEYWKNSGDAALEGLFGVKRGSVLTAPHRLAGAALGAAWAVAGAVYGAGAAFLTGAYEGARQVVYEILPFLRAAFETAMKVLRRIVPFVFGLLAGLVSGVVGSAAFGALLLGRPYFKHVVAQDFERRGALAALGNLFLKLVALVLGALFGLGGLVVGVIAALPYALTASVALAFRFAEIGGPAQRYFDHWSYGALREEMRRINQLTSRFKFEDAAEGRDPSLAAGWIRMANILPATIAAVFAAGIAGYVSYFRSLAAAYRSSTSGRPIPAPTVDEESRREWERTWSRAGRTARHFLGWALTGASVGLAIWLFSAWTPLGLAGWLLVGAAAGVGAVLALSVASVIAMIALILWISGQLR